MSGLEDFLGQARQRFYRDCRCQSLVPEGNMSGRADSSVPMFCRSFIVGKLREDLLKVIRRNPIAWIKQIDPSPLQTAPPILDMQPEDLERRIIG